MTRRTVHAGRAPLDGRGRLAVPLLLLAALASVPASARAQEWSVEARGGELRYEGGPGLEASSLVAGLRYTSPATSLLVSGGVPLSAEDPLWGALAASRRLAHESGRFTFGIDLAGDAFAQRDRTAGALEDGLPGDDLLPGRRPAPDGSLDGWSASARAMPLVGVEAGPVGLELRAGGAFYRSEFAGEGLDRDLLDADARLSFSPSPRALVAATARRAVDEEASYDRVGASAALALERLTLWGSVGSWLEEGIGDLEWSGGVALDVSDRVALRLGARRDAFDPLYLTPPRTTWGVGVSVALSRPTRPKPPIPASYTDDGVATIVLDGDAAASAVEPGTTPRIAGDFTGWDPVPMEPTSDGWRFTRALEPGVYSYAFVTPEGEWFVPRSHPGRKPDDFGGWVAVLVVEAS